MSTISVQGKDLKKLQGIPLGIQKVYNFYRSGYVKAENKFHTYIYFPSRLVDEIVYSEDRTLTAPVEGEKMELREKIWNKDAKKFEFHKLHTRLDLKAFPKVIDITAVASAPFEVEAWDSAARARLPVTVEAWTEFTLEWFSAGKVRDLLDTMELAEDIPVDPSTQKRGYDWEDNIRKRLEGKSFTFKTTGTWLETRYRYKEVTFPTIAKVEDEELTIEDIPF